MSKVLPNNEEYEKSVLSTAFQNPERIDDLIELGVSEDTFYSHREIWKALKEIHDKEEPIDFIAVSSYLENRGDLDRVGGPGGTKLTEIYTYSITDSNFLNHVEKLKDLEFRRAAKLLGSRISNASDDLDSDLVSLLTSPIDDLLEQRHHTSRDVSGKAAAQEFYSEWEEEFLSGKNHRLVQCGIPAIDAKRGGLDSPGVVYVGGYPGSGKTALLVQVICYHLKNYEDSKILFFSLEMSRKEVIQRAMIHLCQFDDPRWITAPALARMDWLASEKANGRDPKGATMPNIVNKRMVDAMALLATDRLIIEDDGGQDIETIMAKARIHSRKGKLTLVGVDHLQLVSGLSKRDGVEQKMTEASAGIRRAAKITQCTWIGLCQMTEPTGGSGAPRFKYAQSLLEDAYIAFRIDKEKEQDEVNGIKVMKDRNGGTLGEMFPVAFDGAKQTFYTSHKSVSEMV